LFKRFLPFILVKLPFFRVDAKELALVLLLARFYLLILRDFGRLFIFFIFLDIDFFDLVVLS